MPICSGRWRRRCGHSGQALNSWLSLLTGRRIEKLLFAATKADHLHHTSHDRLEAILRAVTDRAIARATDAGADVGVMALAALRATREAEAKQGGERLAVHRRHAVAGRTRSTARLSTAKRKRRSFRATCRTTQRRRCATLGNIQRMRRCSCASGLRVRRRLGPSGEVPPLPHIRLDRALQFLIGDRLA